MADQEQPPQGPPAPPPDGQSNLPGMGDGGNKNIINVNIEDEMQRSYLDYYYRRQQWFGQWHRQLLGRSQQQHHLPHGNFDCRGPDFHRQPGCGSLHLFHLSFERVSRVGRQ